MAHNLGTACLMSLHLDQHNAQQYIVNVSSKRRLQCFFHLEKIKKQNAFPCNFRRNIQGPLFLCQNV